MDSKSTKVKDISVEKKEPDSATCGLVMPIASLDGCPSEHWVEVKNIITDSVESISAPKFKVKLVSDADSIGIIQKRIVQNVYESDILVCDVSGKNPNVMFELGMRLAFDKSVVIVKDDKTDYSFDTGIIEHLSYPRDLRFQNIVDFKKLLAEKVLGTLKTSRKNPEDSPYLKNFGRFKVANLDETTVSTDRLLLEMIEDLRMDFRRLQRSISSELFPLRKYQRGEFESRAWSAILDYASKMDIKDLSIFLDNQEFMERLAEELNASRYFGSRQEYEDEMTHILKKIINIKT